MGNRLPTAKGTRGGRACTRSSSQSRWLLRKASTSRVAKPWGAVSEITSCFGSTRNVRRRACRLRRQDSGTARPAS